MTIQLTREEPTYILPHIKLLKTNDKTIKGIGDLHWKQDQNMADFNQLTGPLLPHLMTIYIINRHTNVADFNQLSGSLHPHLMKIYAGYRHRNEVEFNPLIGSLHPPL
jgi:hypothetical protein